jgi:hypothetical protein
MNQNFTIGQFPIDNLEEAKLDFHQYNIYNNQWPQSGFVCFDFDTKNFYIQSFTPPPPKTKSFPLTEKKEEKKKVVIPRKILKKDN